MSYCKGTTNYQNKRRGIQSFFVNCAVLELKTMKPATKQYMFIAAVFVATVALITFSLPREKTVNYDFALGKPWKYEQLTAPFNFAVYKSEQALQQERSDRFV